MSFQTGEDEQSLRKILDLLRTGGILLLLLHYFYHACPSCREWQNATPIADSILSAIAATGRPGSTDRNPVSRDIVSRDVHIEHAHFGVEILRLPVRDAAEDTV